MKKYSKVSRTDWARIKKMKDKQIDYSDNPELDDIFLKEAVAWHGPKKQITLRIDPDTLEFFRAMGKGYQTVMGNVLRKYVETSRHHHHSASH